MAEQNIVDGLQNLRVVAAYDLAVMDDLARDFANALEDFPMTTRLRSGGNEQIRRRRFRKRRPKGTLLLCSDSDSDHEKMITNDSSNKKFSDSDSDDVEFFAQQRYSLSRFPAISAPLLVESDSVTDCLPPNHPPRRRRMLKKMNVEDIKLEVENSFLKRAEVLRKDLKCKSKFPDPTPVRKRKRSIRESRTFLETNDATSSRLLSPCSCKSDVENSTAEERDADDEQSDFYFESDHSYLGPPYKLPATSPPTNSSNNNQNFRRAAPWMKDLKLKRNKNHTLKHFLHEQLTIALNGRLFIPAKRRLVANLNFQQPASAEGSTEQGVPSTLQDMETNCFATPLSSPPLNCNKRHKLWHEAVTPNLQPVNGQHPVSVSRTKKKKLFNFISGWLATSSTC